MTEMQHIAHLMKDLEQRLSKCMRCGSCQSVCPLYQATGREADVARGKLALLDGLISEMFDNPQGVFERLNRCLLCGSCEHNCPSGVNVFEIFLKARAILSGVMGLSPIKRAILRRMLSQPQAFDLAMNWVRKFQKVFTKPANAFLGTSCARIASPLLRHRHFTPLAPLSFHQTEPKEDIPAGASGIKVAFFVGCLIDRLFPHIAQTVVDILAHHGVGVFLPREQVCCGIPAVSSGDTTAFNELIRLNLNLFTREDVDFIVTACATCTATIKKIWPMMMKETTVSDRMAVSDISEKVMDINQFLVSQLGVTSCENERSESALYVTYHDPCHLKKTLGVSSEPRTVIQTNPGYYLKEMPESDWCCGLGGSFNLAHYELSENIGQRKRDNIVASSCSIVSTGCPACMIQISDMLSKSKDTILVKHPIEIYGESLGIVHRKDH